MVRLENVSRAISKAVNLFASQPYLRKVSGTDPMRWIENL
jgi:hypothetical protein